MADDKQAKFLQLYEPVHDRFERFCRARVCGQMDFRDLMNDTLLIAYQKLDTLQSDQAFLAYLFGICIRVVANHLRKKREVLYVADETINNIPDPSRADIGAEVYMLHQALAKLPDDQRESIILYEISGFSVREVAALQNTSESAVKKRLQRGRKKLTQLLVGDTITQTNKA